jgi:DNA repair exonuclease SbcCD nuclease subunit
MTDSEYVGLLFIGDPHLEGRQPGFRRDDYPNVILEKLEWCLKFASENRLLPAVLGDLFDKPRDNPNWLMCRLLEIFQGEVLGLYGNHDVHYVPELTANDSLNLLVKAGRIRLVDAASPWVGRINGRRVFVGGSSYRQEIPESFVPQSSEGEAESPLVIWMTHHDILIPGYDEGRLKPTARNGIDLVINGHIHRKLEEVRTQTTLWLTPGNISRRSRNDATRAHVPSVLRVIPTRDGYIHEHVTVPHLPFDEVFHEALVEPTSTSGASAFIAGLAELQSRRTESGAGLADFLKQNLTQFDSDVANEIMRLADEVTNDEAD